MMLSTPEVPFRIGANAIIVDAQVNGRPVALLLDTGYSGAVIVHDGIDIGTATGVQRLRDFVGVFEARTVAIESLRIGSVTVPLRGKDAVQKPMPHMSTVQRTTTDGILGLEALREFVVEINFERKVLIFHPPDYDITALPTDQERTFLARLLPIGANSLELPVETADGRRLTMALDTGNAFFATTHRDVLERVGLWAPGRAPQYLRTSMIASGLVDSWYLRVRGARVFGVPVSDSVWNVIDLPSSSAEGDGTIGYEFLRHFNVTFDLARRRVRLENFTGETGNDAPAEPGVYLRRLPDRRFVVSRLVPHGPAAAAGVREGDHLIGIDGRDLVNLGQATVESLLEGPPESTVRLELSREGQPLTISVDRRRLVNE